MAALLSLNTPNKFALPGVVEKTSKTDRFIISQQQLIRYTQPRLEADGEAHRGSSSLELDLVPDVTGRGRETGLYCVSSHCCQ